MKSIKRCRQTERKLKLSHNIIQPCGWVPWPQNTSITSCDPLQQTGNIHLLLICLCRTWKSAWSHTPSTIDKNYCSSSIIPFNYY